MSDDICVVHGKPLDQYWMCEQFWTCADAMYDYVCHDESVCVPECTHGAEYKADQIEGRDDV